MGKKLLCGVLSLVVVLLLLPTACGITPSNEIVPPPTNIAIVDSMNVAHLSYPPPTKRGLYVYLKPVNAKANVAYLVDLYYKSTHRDQSSITWTQPEIDVRTIKPAWFYLTDDQISAYYPASLSDSNWWKSIFSIQIHE
jgi:hypothetical protein